MPALLLDGRAAAARVLQRVQEEAVALMARGIVPGLATVLVGDNPASAVYVGQKIKTCEKHGLRSIHVPLPATVSEEDLIKKVKELNDDPAVHGIIVQLPVTKGLKAEKVLRRAINFEEKIRGEDYPERPDDRIAYHQATADQGGVVRELRGSHQTPRDGEPGSVRHPVGREREDEAPSPQRHRHDDRCGNQHAAQDRMRTQPQ